jgi:hypothetical protein
MKRREFITLLGGAAVSPAVKTTAVAKKIMLLARIAHPPADRVTTMTKLPLDCEITSTNNLVRGFQIGTHAIAGQIRRAACTMAR